MILMEKLLLKSNKNLNKIKSSQKDAFIKAIKSKKIPDLIKPFNLSRFKSGALVNEKASATAAALH